MKKFIALSFSCFLAQGAMAQEKMVPAFPEGCSDQIDANGLYCSGRTIDGAKATVTFVAVASKNTFPTVDSLIARYTSFGEWPAYANKSASKVLEFKAVGGSTSLPDLVDPVDGLVIKRQAYDYSLKIQGIPLLKQPVAGTTYNKIVTPFAGALASLEFVAQTAPSLAGEIQPKGMKSQVGSVHVLECDSAKVAICDENQWMLVYETTAQPDVSFAMNIAANTVTAGIEDLLIGLLAE